MFSVSERSQIRAELVERAQADSRIIGAALVGSAARGTEDRWSDIDLVLQLRSGADEPTVVEDWTRAIDGEFGVADTFDVYSAGARYRVFFLQSSLQIDVSFWPDDQFRSTEPGFRLLFGQANPSMEEQPFDADAVIGRGWLYAIHARSAVARGKLWQAAMMLDELRNNLIALQCIRVGLNPSHGRDVDQLPAEDRAALDASRATHITRAVLDSSRILLTNHFLNEIARHDPERYARLRQPFAELTTT